MPLNKKSKNWMKKLRKLIQQRLPIARWLPKYSRLDGISDAVAGFTLGLTLMPQSIAYASLAGLSAQYGLYTAFIGSLIYVFFGTIKEVSIGPTCLMSLLTYEYTHNLSEEYVFLLTFLAGIVQLLMGIFNLGFLVDFISMPVTSGFTSATSVIIIASQLKGLFGLRGFKSSSFVDTLRNLYIHSSEIRLWDSILGVSCCVFLLCFRKLCHIKIGSAGNSTKKETCLKKTLWFLSISRNAIVVLICSTIAFCMESNGKEVPFLLSGKIRPGLPSFQLPPFHVQSGNESYNFPEMAFHLGAGIIVVPIVAILQTAAIAKAFSVGKTLDASQEMLTLGLCNIAGSCVQAMPSCGAFTRSAVSDASGVRTPLAGLYSGSMILLALSFLTPYFYFIPRSTLAAVLICAIMFLINWELAHLLWKTNKKDFFALSLTFFASLVFGVESGLLFGIVFNILHLLYMWARPNIQVEFCKSLKGVRYVTVRVDSGLFYSAINFIQGKLSQISMNEGMKILPVVLDCSRFRGGDYSAVKGLEFILEDFESRKQVLIFYKLPKVLSLTLTKYLKRDILCCNSEDELEEILNEKVDLRRGSKMCHEEQNLPLMP